jgi:hypothetical protein
MNVKPIYLVRRRSASAYFIAAKVRSVPAQLAEVEAVIEKGG